MIVDSLLVLAGLVLLVLGGDNLVKGAVNLSLRLGVTPTVVGLTVVAFGTSAPEMLVSATRHRFSRQQSSITARMRNLREAPKVSATKSSDQRWFGNRASGIGVRVPRARLRPLRRLTDSPSSR